jgi:hypothetical protein
VKAISSALSWAMLKASSLAPTKNVIELLRIQSALPQGRMKLEVGTHRLELESTLSGHPAKRIRTSGQAYVMKTA